MDWLFRIGVGLIVFALGSLAILFQRRTGYELNPFIVGAWIFMFLYALFALPTHLPRWYRKVRGVLGRFRI